MAMESERKEQETEANDSQDADAIEARRSRAHRILKSMGEL